MSTIRSRCLVVLLLVLVALTRAAPAAAQTVILTDTSRAAWIASLDHSVTFGTPPVPVLTSYQVKLYLRTLVVGTTEPTSTPAFTFDWGKPALDASLTALGPLLKPLVLPNTEYVAFLRAVGPGGISTSAAVSVPFGWPAAPRAVTSAVSITP